METITILKIIFAINLGLLALDHLVTGFLGLLFPKYAIRVYKRLFGASIPETKEYYAILRPWGALGVFAAFVGILPIIDPAKYNIILFFLLVLLAMRVIIRTSLRKEAEEFIRLSTKRNIFHILLITLCGGIIAAELILFS